MTTEGFKQASLHLSYRYQLYVHTWPRANPEAMRQGLFISISHMSKQAHRDEK